MQHVQKEQNEIKLEIKDSGNGKKKFYNEIFNEDREWPALEHRCPFLLL